MRSPALAVRVCAGATVPGASGAAEAHAAVSAQTATSSSFIWSPRNDSGSSCRSAESEQQREEEGDDRRPPGEDVEVGRLPVEQAREGDLAPEEPRVEQG